MTATDTNRTVYISYRRDVTKELALLLFKELTHRGFDVFLDKEGTNTGDIAEPLLSQIEAREHFIVLLAQGTLERCRKPEDWLRREIEFAIQKKRNIISVLYEGFSFDDNLHYLTGALRNLADCQIVALDFDDFDAGVDQLCQQHLSQLADRQTLPAPTRDHRTAEQLVLQAYAKCGEGDFEGGIIDFTGAIELNPAYNAAYYNRGKAHFQIGNLDAAIADYSDTLRLDPDDVDAYISRGITWANQGNLEQAIDDFSDVIRLRPDHANAYYNRGVAYANQGDLEDAIADFSEAIHYWPDLAAAYVSRGTTYQQMDDLDAAIADLTDAIHLNPRSIYAYHKRGAVYFQQGAFAQAQADFQYANALLPDSQVVLVGLAITHHAQGNSAEAKQLWQILIAKDERHKDADWVKREHHWHDTLVDEARKIIAAL